MLRNVAILMLCCASPALAQQTQAQQPMPFDICTQSLQMAAANALQPPTTTIDTPDTKQVQFPISGSQVTVTCTSSDQMMTIVGTPN